jgi:hypothetical protein
MVKVNSSRAKKILEAPRFLKKSVSSSMRKFPGSEINLWVAVEGEPLSVKNLSFSGALDSVHILILESMASLLIDKKISLLETLTVRECEAFLRDRNSEPAFEGWDGEIEKTFHSVFLWIRAWPFKNSSQSYSYPREKGPFRQLKLADKVRELKAFLGSAEIASLYGTLRTPELIDVVELTAYVDAPYSGETERSLFQELHERGVEIFRDEELNFIPEGR